MLKAQNISYKVGKKNVVQDCSLMIKPGTFTAIVGPNGAGKTSLLRIISNEIKKYKGEVSINGNVLSKISEKKLSILRAVLPQHTSVNFPFTIEQIIEIGRYPHATTRLENDAIIREVMNLTALSSFKGRTYQTLSGGEQQRVQLARVIAQLWDKSDVGKYLLLDEPTSSLDLSQQHALLGLARKMCERDIGVLAVLHDLNLASQYADEILLMKNGQPVAYGSTHHVMTQSIIEETFSYPVEVTYDELTHRPRIYARSMYAPKNEFESIKHFVYEYNNYG